MHGFGFTNAKIWDSEYSDPRFSWLRPFGGSGFGVRFWVVCLSWP